MLGTTKCCFGVVEITTVLKQIAQLTETDIIIIVADKAIAEEGCYHLVLCTQPIFPKISHKSYLQIVIEERLYLITQLTGTNGIVVKVVKPLIEQLKQRSTILCMDLLGE